MPARFDVINVITLSDYRNGRDSNHRLLDPLGIREVSDAQMKTPRNVRGVMDGRRAYRGRLTGHPVADAQSNS
jgi:hypothetical protein